ncbi:hypothetical protein CMUS01_15970, partial [Colletotrichum musicola]
MARVKRPAHKSVKGLISWTRFHLPREKEWPAWSVDHDDVHVGPLTGVEGWWTASLGRMVDNPEQAVYIIEWTSLDDLKNFQSSPACAEFLRNLPEHDDSEASIESGSALSHLTVDDAPSPSPPAASRFLTFKHALEGVPTREVEGRVTLTAFMVPGKVENVALMWHDHFKGPFETFLPRGSAFMAHASGFRYSWASVWFWLLTEDRWVEKTFGKLQQQQQTQGDESHDRTIFCRFQLWPSKYGATPEHEAASAADPQARESWARAAARVMPPATAWAQERWDIRGVPRFYPPEPEFDPEEDPEYAREQQRLMKEYLEF